MAPFSELNELLIGMHNDAPYLDADQHGPQ
jgi:hypothetical protein